MKRINFYTLYPEASNMHLVKDVGQIPYILAKNYNINSYLVCSNVDEKGPYIENVDGLRIKKIPCLKNNSSISGLIFLLFNAKRIDWLNLYHAGRQSYYWSRIYKLINPLGKVYLKLDLDFRSCDNYDNDINERKIFSDACDIADVISVECEEIQTRIQKYTKKKIHILGNGYCKSGKIPDLNIEKSNQFLTVGRLGSKQKATEILLEAFKNSAESHNWNLVLVGHIDKDFKPIISNFFCRYPSMKKRIRFIGEINDRNELNKYYVNSKVFVLPSKWEGYPLVGGEALSCGCQLLLSSAVPPYNEMTNNGRYGTKFIVDDISDLTEKLIKSTTKQYNYQIYKEISDYANRIFSWDEICSNLHEILFYEREK